MDSINSSMGMGPQMYAMKKAIDTHEQGIMKLLERCYAFDEALEYLDEHSEESY